MKVIEETARRYGVERDVFWDQPMAKPTITERVDRHDREIAAIRKLVLTGMKMLVEVQRAQKKTEQTLERFIRSL